MGELRQNDMWEREHRRAKMNILYYAPGACSLAVHIVLEWIGAPYQVISVNPHDPAYLAINPAGAVPALDFGGKSPLTQAAAILKYLAVKNPEADLLDPRSPESEAQLDRWSDFLTGDLHPAFFPVFAPARYTAASDDASREQVLAAALALVQTKLTLLEAQLAAGRWLVGNKRTIVDAYATPMLRWASIKLDGGLANYPALAQHQEHMLRDPSVRRVMEVEATP